MTEFDHTKHDSRLAAYGGVVLQWFEFTGGSQRRFVNMQNKMLPGYPRDLFDKPTKMRIVTIDQSIPGENLVCVLTNRHWLPPVGLIIVTQLTMRTAKVS